MPTKTDPIAERARLEGELRSATAALQAVGERRKSLTTEGDDIDAERLRAYEALARGEQDAPKRVTAAEKRRTALLADIERVGVEMEGAKLARQNVSTELSRLLRDELATFADEADEHTQEAVEAIAAVEEPYRRALEAWQVAEAAWRPLLPAVRDAVEQGERDRGVYISGSRLAAAVGVAAFPLADAAHLFARVASSELVPRPAGLRPTEDEQD